MNPLFTLIFDPTAGSAGFNLISVMFYTIIILALFIITIERSFK